MKILVLILILSLSVLSGPWKYKRLLTDLNSTGVTSVVRLSLSSFDFKKAKSDGSDIRIYDSTSHSFDTIWIFNSSEIYFKANLTHQHYLYYGSSDTAVSNFGLVFSHGAGFDSSARYPTPWGDLTVKTKGTGALATRYPSDTGPSDLRNLRVWSMDEESFLAYDSLVAHGITRGAYRGLREFTLPRDSLNRIMRVGGKYYAYFARRPQGIPDKIDCWSGEATDKKGPYTNFTQRFASGGATGINDTVRLCYSSSLNFYNGVYYLFLNIGWSVHGVASPSLTVYISTSNDCLTWNNPTKCFDPGILKDHTGLACTDFGNAWVYRDTGNVWIMVGEAERAGSSNWTVNGVSSTDLVNWTALNGGSPLVNYNQGGVNNTWDSCGVANPKIAQDASGRYIIIYNGADSGEVGHSNWEIGFATSPTRTGTFVKLPNNPVAGRKIASYGLETAHFSFDTTINTWFNVCQRFDSTSASGKFHQYYPIRSQGGMMLSRKYVGGVDGALVNVQVPTGTFTAETRSILPSNYQGGYAPTLIGVDSLDKIFPCTTSSSNYLRRVCLISRWSSDYKPPISTFNFAGDLTFAYYDPSSTVHYWGGTITGWSLLSTTVRPADFGREIRAVIKDDGTNYRMYAYYADGAEELIDSCFILKTSCRPTVGGRVLFSGDYFSDAWTGPFYLKYFQVKPFVATEPNMSLGTEIGLRAAATSIYTISASWFYHFRSFHR